MALPDQTDTFHRDISMMTAIGSAVSLIGLSSFMTAYEYQDFDRVQLHAHHKMEQLYFERRRASIAVMAIAAFLYVVLTSCLNSSNLFELCRYVSGIVLITLGITLYPNEREEVATNIPGQIQQIQTTAGLPSINEPAILAGLSAALLVAGMAYSGYHFTYTESWGWPGSSMYAAGWVGLAFAASMNNTSINSLVANRLAWTLCGASAVVAGTFIVPWQLQHNYVSGPGWPIAALGLGAFVVGTSYVTEAPTTVS